MDGFDHVFEDEKTGFEPETLGGRMTRTALGENREASNLITDEATPSHGVESSYGSMASQPKNKRHLSINDDDEDDDFDDARTTIEPSLVEKAINELNEKPEWRKRDIEALREMIENHPGLNARTDDSFLLAFLRARKFDYDRAFSLLVNYYALRAKNPDLFRDFRPSALEGVLDDELVGVLKNRDQLGRRLVVLRPGLWNPSSYPIADIFRLLCLTLDVLFLEERTQICGVAMLVDFSAFAWRHFRSVGAGDLKKFASLLQDCVPVRVKAVHCVREHAAVGVLTTLLRPFLKEKLLRRLHFHGSRFDQLHEDISPGRLPTEFEGADGPLDFGPWRRHFLAADERFREDAAGLGVDGEVLAGSLTKGGGVEDCGFVFGIYQRSEQDFD